MSLNLNIKNWRGFRIGDLFSITRGLRHIAEDREPGNIRYFSASQENNGLTDMISNPLFIDRDALIYSTFGDCYYVGGKFTASDEISILKNDNLTIYSGFFVSTIITANKYKYAYGRKAFQNKFVDEIIKLPVNVNGDPDRKFMEDYVKSLHYKPIKTKNMPGFFELTNKEWKEFNLYPDYFDILPGKYYYPDEYEDGKTPYISASNENNGIQQFINLEPDFQGNCIITGKVGCTAFYQKSPFCATSDVNVFVPKFGMTQNIGLFLVSIINFSENYKRGYGRQCRVGNSKKIKIKLPADKYGEPDREFMENYIKNLPYGDRI